ncbi:1-phosphatidylinositol phosphodiesterase [Ceratocystis lukuohia]|uniref:1-phosphatidylinositol phosphodiesterase n=1 Tax=Ceratocystis lukuohia TaxID=2019550 RepID=A0ABR4MA90_9PEZI
MYFSLFTILAFLAFSQAATLRSVDDYWSFDVGAGQNADWMSNIADDTPLSSLSIPGTHRSVTDGFKSFLAKTQSESLEQQLEGGIRYIDISCQALKSGIKVFQRRIETTYTLSALLGTLNKFLTEHSRETIILRIKAGSFTDPIPFLKSFQEFMDSDYYRSAISRIYSPDTDKITAAPTLGKIRGKIFILQDFKTSPPGRYGLPWKSDAVSSYSTRVTIGSERLKSIWANVKSHLSEAPSAESNQLRITYTSAGSGVYPINIAARHSPSSGMNKLLGEYLANKGHCYGIIVMDFPGQYLVQQILNLNDKFQSPNIPGAPDDHPDANVVDQVDSPSTASDDGASSADR